MIEYIETSCIGKKSAELCEDNFFAGEHFAAVIDGSTSKASRTYHPEMSNGKLASFTIKNAISQLPFDADLQMVCKVLEDAIRALYNEYSADAENLLCHPENRVTASAIIYSEFQKKIWMIGDCLCRVNGMLFTNDKPHEAKLANRRSEEIRRLLTVGHTIEDLQANDLGRQLILQDIIESTKGQNITFSVVDGFPIAKEFVRTIAVECGSEVILASDGYPMLYDTLEQTERELKQIIESDPLFIDKFKATKGLRPGQTSFDDRTFVRFEVRG